MIGYLGEVHPTVAANYGIGRPCLYRCSGYAGDRRAVQHLTANMRESQNSRQLTRDISMLVPKEILAGDIEKVFDEKGGTEPGKLSAV